LESLGHNVNYDSDDVFNPIVNGVTNSNNTNIGKGVGDTRPTQFVILLDGIVVP
jgi:hypothetical protein